VCVCVGFLLNFDLHSHKKRIFQNTLNYNKKQERNQKQRRRCMHQLLDIFYDVRLCNAASKSTS
jgi:hypothetical protein